MLRGEVFYLHALLDIVGGYECHPQRLPDLLHRGYQGWG